MKVLEGQTIFDVAIQECGSAEAGYDLAMLNGISVTDDLTAGQELLVPEATNKQIKAYYSQKNIKPATAYREDVTEISRVFFEELPIEFM